MADFSFEAIAHALARRIEPHLPAGFRVWVARGALYVGDGRDWSGSGVPYLSAATEDARRREAARVVEQLLTSIEDYVTITLRTPWPSKAGVGQGRALVTADGLSIGWASQDTPMLDLGLVPWSELRAEEVLLRALLATWRCRR